MPLGGRVASWTSQRERKGMSDEAWPDHQFQVTTQEGATHDEQKYGLGGDGDRRRDSDERLDHGRQGRHVVFGFPFQPERHRRDRGRTPLRTARRRRWSISWSAASRSLPEPTRRPRRAPCRASCSLRAARDRARFSCAKAPVSWSFSDRHLNHARKTCNPFGRRRVCGGGG